MYFRTPSLLPWLYPGLIWKMPASQNTLFLTFDDGPVPGPTDFVLDTLSVYNAKATFFCIGDNVRKHPRQYQRMVSEGHAIGNHTFNHLNGWRTKDEDYISNVQKCGDLVANSKLFRPPYGRIKRSQIRKLANLHIIMWDVLTYDYSARMPAERCLKGAIAATRPGSIVVFHDSLKAERNLTKVLPSYLAHFSSQGFKFSALSEDSFNSR